MHGDTVIDSITNLNFNTCSIAELQSFLGAGVSYQLDGVESGGSVSHLWISCSRLVWNISHNLH